MILGQKFGITNEDLTQSLRVSSESVESMARWLDLPDPIEIRKHLEQRTVLTPEQRSEIARAAKLAAR